MGKLGRIETATLDMNSNTQNQQEFFLYDLIDIGLKSGRLLFFGTSYEVRTSYHCESEYIVKNDWKRKILLRALQIVYISYLLVPFITETYTLSPCCLVNFIKKGLHCVLVFSLLATYYSLEVQGRCSEYGALPIFKQCMVLQRKFRALGIRFPARTKMRAIGWTIAVAACIAGILRQCIFAYSNSSVPWYRRYARHLSSTLTMGIWVADNSTVSSDVELAFGWAGVVLDGLVANCWFYGQLIHFCFVATMWLVFYKLNKAWESGHLRVKHVPDVIDLHLHSTKLLNLINQVISPLTFASVLYNIVCLCFWVNYLAIGYQASGKASYIGVALCNFVKTGVELLMEADVNSKAHKITEWLEMSCTETEKYPQIDPVKLTIFTSQIYNKDCTGFRGLSYFVVTPKLATTIVGIVITYSVAVNQFCHSNY